MTPIKSESVRARLQPCLKSRENSGALQAAEKVLMFVTVFEVAMFYKRSMRGDDKQQAAMFSYVTLEQRIP
ncbi:MAG: hypothetical protein P4M01_10155, partial [Acidobacteriota bacterium]|nr:hypothetical protein [Acidobacteriota bacterium]